jgi:hypothetical protein
MGFLRDLLAARKSLALYPSGTAMTRKWLQRVQGSLEQAVQAGLAFPIRLDRTGFACAGEEPVESPPLLEQFRADLYLRGIGEFSIDQGVEAWEIQVFLELLNLGPEEVLSLEDPPAYLRERGVSRIRVGAPRAPGGTGGPDHGGAEGAEPGAPGVALASVDAVVDDLIEAVDEHFAGLCYDPTALLDWFLAISVGGRTTVLVTGVRMLAAMAEAAADQELRIRTVLEAALRLPDATLGLFLREGLVPLAATDRAMFDLLAHTTEDELETIARHVPRSQLLALTAELRDSACGEGQQHPLILALTRVLELAAAPRPALPPLAGLAPDDPLLVELRQEILAACEPGALLERSADVLLALAGLRTVDEDPGFALDALSEVIDEAMERGTPRLAVRVLRSLPESVARKGRLLPDDAAHISRVRRRAGDSAHAARLAGLLRDASDPVSMDIVADYLRHVAPEGVDGFVALLAAETDRRVRTRMADALTRAGAAVIRRCFLASRTSGGSWCETCSTSSEARAGAGTRARGDRPRPPASPGAAEAVRTISLIGGEDTIGFDCAV